MGIVNSERLARFLTNLKDAWAELFMESQSDLICVADSADGVNYTATVPGVTSLYSGLKVTVKFSRNSASVIPKLNVNGLGAKNIRQPLFTNNTATAPGPNANWLTSACPVVLTYTGSMWKTDFQRPDADNLYGTAAIANGGTGATTAEAARANLGAASAADLAALIARVEALESQ
jgi:hypothetical protein